MINGDLLYSYNISVYALGRGWLFGTLGPRVYTTPRGMAYGNPIGYTKQPAPGEYPGVKIAN